MVMEMSGTRKQPADNSSYDLKLPAAMMQAMPAWFNEIPWHLCQERELDDDMLATLEYMDLIEGHVCGGYLHLALASPRVRANTERTDFAAGWGVQENWHGIALHRFLDQYRGISVSTRASMQDRRRAQISFAQRHSHVLAGAASSLAPDVYPALYACMGYRNEVMTMRGYGSLRSKINAGGVHPVLDPLLRNLMRDEADHASNYRRIAEGYLTSNPRARKVVRMAMNKWWGIVGENFAGGEHADRVIRYLFRDQQGRDLANKIDELVGQLPGLKGIRPMKLRLQQALQAAPA